MKAAALDRFYARLHTPVRVDPAEDRREVELSYEQPHRFRQLRWFPDSDWMMLRPDRTDTLGFLAAVAVALGVVALVFGVAALSWP